MLASTAERNVIGRCVRNVRNAEERGGRWVPCRPCIGNPGKMGAFCNYVTMYRKTVEKWRRS